MMKIIQKNLDFNTVHSERSEESYPLKQQIPQSWPPSE